MRLLYILIVSLAFSLNMYSQKVQTITSEDWKSGGWVNSLKYIYSYDSDVFLRNVLTQKWNTISSNWFDMNQQVYTNDMNGLVQQAILQSRDTAMAIWNSTQRQTSSYNNKYLVDTLVNENYNAGNWKQSSRLYYNYDTSGYLVDRISQNWNAPLSRWDNYTRVNYTYNSSGLQLEYTSENWDVSTSTWKPSRHASYTYNSANKVSTFIVVSAILGDSTKFSKQINTYDSIGYLTNGLYQNWNIDSSTWRNSSQINYTNLSDGSIHQTISQLWDNATNDWINAQRTMYTYTIPMSILDVNDLLFTLYPNPSKNVLNITLGNDENAVVKVLDMQGKVLISTPAFVSSTSLNISELSSGLHILHLQQGSKITTTKFVKD